MQHIEIPIHDRKETIQLPDAWHVNWAPIENLPTLSPTEIRKSLCNPIGTKRLSELARGKGNVVVVVDDNTRPTPAMQFLPYVIEELHKGGVADSQIRFIAGLALHRPMTLGEFRRKVGQEIVDGYQCINPSPWEDLVDLGTTEGGVPVKMNVDYVEADLRVTCGGIIPHPGAGFGGGAKLTMPGVCSYETISNHHVTGRFSHDAMRGEIVGNSFRAEIENIAALCPPEFLVNPVLNQHLEIAGLFCGHYIEAHRAGVTLAKKAYSVRATPNADLAVICGSPQDSELMQGMKSLENQFGVINSVKADGAVLYTADAEEGYGYHQLQEHARRVSASPRNLRPGHYLDREMICYSPKISPLEFQQEVPESFSLFRNLEQAIDQLSSHSRGKSTVINIFPHGPISLYAGK